MTAPAPEPSDGRAAATRHLSPRRFPIQIFLVALCLRLIPVLLTPGLGIGLDDMFQYDMLGRSLASGNGFRWYAAADLQRMAPLLHVDPSTLAIDPRGLVTTFRAPLYPALVGLIYAVFGMGANRFLAVRLVQALLGAGLAPGTYCAARLAFSADDPLDAGRISERAAKAAAWVAAAYPVLLMYPLALATENVFFLLVLVDFVILLDLARKMQVADVTGIQPRSIVLEAGLAGLVLGLSALTRSVIVPFGLAAVLWIAFGLRRGRLALVSALVMVITVLPWIIRNTVVAGRPTGIESSLGYNLYLGYHPESTGTFAYGPSLDLLSILNDSRRDQFGAERAMAFIAENPTRSASLLFDRLGYFFDFDLRGFTYFYTNDLLGPLPPAFLVGILVLLIVPFGILAVSALLGLNALPRAPRSSLLLLLFGAYLLPHVLVLSEERFHLAMIPLMAIWAAAFWTKPARTSAWSSAAVVLAACAIILLVANWGLELAREGPTLIALLAPGGHQLYLPY